MGVSIVPPPSYTEARISDLKPGIDWISDNALIWHRLLDLDVDSPTATLTVGDTAEAATTLPCDPGGYILRLDPHDHPRH